MSCKDRFHRFPFSQKMVNELQQSKNSDNTKLCIHAEGETADVWKQYIDNNNTNLETVVYKYSNLNYTDRIKVAHSTNCEYSCKIDDDVLFSRHVWDYMIDNLDSISEKNPIMSPILSNGIPNVDLFVKDFLNEEDLTIAKSLFLKGEVQANLWGLDYSEINKKIKKMEVWDDREYWDFVTNVDTKWDVRNVPWYYFIVRGVHPARFSFEYNNFIANKILENRSKFFEKQNYYLEEYPAPYFTNNIFICKTNFWRDSFKLFYDGWDEGQLTLKMLMNKAQVLYVRNGFGIHMAYGMTQNQRVIEETYIRNL